MTVATPDPIAYERSAVDELAARLDAPGAPPGPEDEAVRGVERSVAGEYIPPGDGADETERLDHYRQRALRAELRAVAERVAADLAAGLVSIARARIETMRRLLAELEPLAARRWQRARDAGEAFRAEQERTRARREAAQPPLRPGVKDAPLTNGFAIAMGDGSTIVFGAQHGGSSCRRCRHCGDHCGLTAGPGLLSAEDDAFCVDCIHDLARGRAVTGTLPERCAQCDGSGDEIATDAEGEIDVSCVACGGRGIAVMPREEQR